VENALLLETAGWDLGAGRGNSGAGKGGIREGGKAPAKNKIKSPKKN